MASQVLRRNAIVLGALGIVIVIVGFWFRSLNSSQLPEKPLSDLLTALDQGEVASGTFTSNGDRVDWIDAGGHQFRTFLTSSYADVLVDRFHQEHLAIRATPNGSDNLLLSVIVPNLILVLLIGGFLWYALRNIRRLPPPRA
jgi:ATP-dependent Zn protease